PGRERVFVTLKHKRLIQVVVFRHDVEVPGGINTNFQVTTVGSAISGTFLLGSGSTGAGYQIDLPAYENDLLHSLALTGGMPGCNAAKEILIFRKNPRTAPGKTELQIPEVRVGGATSDHDALAQAAHTVASAVPVTATKASL